MPSDEALKFKPGNSVLYFPWNGCHMSNVERGIVASVNEKYVFVRYGNAKHAIATKPADLRLEFTGDKNAIR